MTHFSVPYAPQPVSAPSADDPTISLCMIVKDEEDHLPDCLESVQGLVTEIVVVDTGSTDRTVGIARSYGARVEHFEWIDDFAAARNHSLQFATCDWILWMDADDRLEPGQHELVRAVLRSGRGQVYTAWIDVSTALPEQNLVEHVRFFRRELGLTFKGAIHENLDEALQRRDSVPIQSTVRIRHVGYQVDAVGFADKLRRNLSIMLPLYQAAADPVERNRCLAYLARNYTALHEWNKGIELGQRFLAASEGTHIALFRQFRYEILIDLFRCYTEVGDEETAERMVADAAVEFGPSRHLYWRTAMQALQAGYLDSAEAWARTVLDQQEVGGEQFNMRYRPGAAELVLGQVAMRRGQAAEAYQRLGQGLGCGDIAFTEGDLHTEFRRDSAIHGEEAARATLIGAVQANPRFTRLAFLAARMFVALDALSSAIAVLRGDGLAAREVEARLLLLECLHRVGDTAGLEEEALRLVSDQAPHNARGWNYLGIALTNQNSLDDARRAFAHAAVLDPDFEAARNNAAAILAAWRQGQTPGGPGSSLLRYRTMQWVSQRRWEAALRGARVLQVLYPEELETARLLALALQHSGMPEIAVRVWQSQRV